jgi:purine-binding chemotaxis protein CheW
VSVIQTETETGALAGKYLTFALADEHYGIEILRVQEIVGLLPITRVPRLPDFVAGVVNLRGKVIPVVDLRLAFGMPAVELNDRTCIVIVRTTRSDGRTTVMGALVDEVSEVADLPSSAIEETPEFGVGVDTSFVKAIGRLEDRVVLLLDVDLVLSGQQLEIVERAAAAAERARTEGGS